MVKGKRIWAVIALLTLALACRPSEKTDAPVTTRAADNLPPASVLIAHHVADYDAWKTAFDDHMQARKDASCLGHYLKRGVDESDMVYIYCLATDVDRLRAFLDSADLAEAMKRAGVVGPPEITLMKPMSRNLVPEQRLPGIIVMHPVEDYGSWRVAYDEFDDFRRQSGIVGHAVSRGFDNPNHVIVYHQANDLVDLRRFIDSGEFKDTLQRAGVLEDPDIRFIQVVDFARY
jgi:hypothetical protein